MTNPAMNKTPENLSDERAGLGQSPCSPIRVTLSRRKGWRMPVNTVKVCRPSKYGNPFDVADVLEHYDGDKIAAQADCVRSYRQWIKEGVTTFCDDGPPAISEIQRDLAGKNLACWCKAGTPCHADDLLLLANSPVRHPDTATES